MDRANPEPSLTIESGPPEEGVRERMFPLLVASGVVLCLVLTASETPLPQTFAAAAFLFFAVFNDVQRQRIPNWLTFPALGIALGLALLGQVETGGGAALAGSALALLVFGIPFACGLLGAGDVKGCMVLGALWGPVALIGTAWWMVVSGGVLAIVIVALRRGGLRDLVRRWALSAWYSVRTQRVVYLTPNSNTAAAGGLPFAVAMGSGASAFQLWGTPWL